MKLAYVLFDGITWLDFFGVYDPVSRLGSMGFMPGLSWDICAFTSAVADGHGLKVTPGKIRTSLADYDALIIPGGSGTGELMASNEFLDWIRAAKDVRYKISVCTGSLVLGAAGLLTDKVATTHFDKYERLRPFCKEVVRDRIVRDGNTITAGAVSSSIDLGLYLCKLWAGQAAHDEIRGRMAYNG